MTYINAIEAAIKAKAPIVAIPVEGHAPVCVNRKRLAAWAKGVRITRTVVIDLPSRSLLLEGVTVRGSVRCKARFKAINRISAMKELMRWSDKEREKIQQKIAQGALSADARRAAKLTKIGIIEELD